MYRGNFALERFSMINPTDAKPEQGNLLAIFLLMAATVWLFLLMTGRLPSLVGRMTSVLPQWMNIPVIFMLPISYAFLTLNTEMNWKARLLSFLLLILSCSFLPVAGRSHSTASFIALGFTYLEMIYLIPMINNSLRGDGWRVDHP